MCSVDGNAGRCGVGAVVEFEAGGVGRVGDFAGWGGDVVQSGASRAGGSVFGGGPSGDLDLAVGDLGGWAGRGGGRG